MKDLLKCTGGAGGSWTIRESIATAILKAERLDWDDLSCEIIDALGGWLMEEALNRGRHMGEDTALDLATATFDRYAL